MEARKEQHKQNDQQRADDQQEDLIQPNAAELCRVRLAQMTKAANVNDSAFFQAQQMNGNRNNQSRQPPKPYRICKAHLAHQRFSFFQEVAQYFIQRIIHPDLMIADTFLEQR